MKRENKIDIRLTPKQLDVVMSVLENALNGWAGRRARIAMSALVRMKLAAAARSAPKKTGGVSND